MAAYLPQQTPLTAGAGLSSLERLVVLVPDADTDEAQLAARVWSLASVRGLAVLLLGTCRQAGDAPRARRRLAVLAALVRDDRVRVDTRLDLESGWCDAVRSVRRSTDLVICHAEQWVTGQGRLSRLLSDEFRASLHVLSGFYPGLAPDSAGRPGSQPGLAVPALILVAFTALQFLIHRANLVQAEPLLLGLSVLAEYGLVGYWYWRSG
jgi:hypothetical protein